MKGKRTRILWSRSGSLWPIGRADWTPRCVLIGGKAAPGYEQAKRIIKLVNNVARALQAAAFEIRFRRLVRRPVCHGTRVDVDGGPERMVAQHRPETVDDIAARVTGPIPGDLHDIEVTGVREDRANTFFIARA